MIQEVDTETSRPSIVLKVGSTESCPPKEVARLLEANTIGTLMAEELVLRVKKGHEHEYIAELHRLRVVPKVMYS